MQVYLKLLANYRDLLPEKTIGNQISIDVPEGTSPETVLEMFSVPPVPESVILVNGNSITSGGHLVEGDVICVFSAMAGG
jgi:sulfur carrier protein ThiS